MLIRRNSKSIFKWVPTRIRRASRVITTLREHTSDRHQSESVFNRPSMCFLETCWQPKQTQYHFSFVLPLHAGNFINFKWVASMPNYQLVRWANIKDEQKIYWYNLIGFRHIFNKHDDGDNENRHGCQHDHTMELCVYSLQNYKTMVKLSYNVKFGRDQFKFGLYLLLSLHITGVL